VRTFHRHHADAIDRRSTLARSSVVRGPRVSIGSSERARALQSIRIHRALAFSQELLGACASPRPIEQAVRQQAGRHAFLEQRRARVAPLELIQECQRERRFSGAQRMFGSR
jgi:hypothetical protein